MFNLRRYTRPIGIAAALLFVILISLTGSSKNSWLSTPPGREKYHDEAEKVIIMNKGKWLKTPPDTDYWKPVMLREPSSAALSSGEEKVPSSGTVKTSKPRKTVRTAKQPSKSTTRATTTTTTTTTKTTTTTSTKTAIRTRASKEKAIYSFRTKNPTITPKGWVYNGRNYKRCRVQTIGCYLPTLRKEKKDPRFFRSETSPQMTDWQCISMCGYSKFSTFAGVRNGNECRCASRPDFIMSLEESDQCSMPCSGDPTLKCGGSSNITMVFRVMGECMEEPPASEVVTVSSILGCYEKPTALSLQMESYKIKGPHFTGQCILQCEKKGLTLAVPEQVTSTCLCGHTTQRFDLQYSVNATMCERDRKKYVSVYRTWTEDRRCGARRFLKEGEWTRSVALATFPGSGNTWLRHLIESTTGIYTGSIYGDIVLFQGGQLGEILPKDSKRVMVIKTHKYEDLGDNSRFDAAINVYRNPYDALMSEYNRQHAHSHTKAVDATTFNTEEMTAMATGRGPFRWRKITETAITSDIPTLIFSYESLVKDPIHWSERMARFILGRSVDEEDLQSRLLCLRLAATGQFKRKKRPLDFEPYTKEAKAAINTEIEKIRNTMEEYGYDLMEDYRRY